MISAALRAAAASVDVHATIGAWDPHHSLSDEQRFAKSEKVKAVAVELRALADASETRKVAFREYEVLKDRLYAFGVSLTPKLAQDVAAAFHDAQGPSQPRAAGWLKGQGGA